MAKLISNFTKEAKLIIQQILDVVSQWESYARTAEVPANLTHEIQKNLRLNL
jgi:serine/threonine-protein kinase HipA